METTRTRTIFNVISTPTGFLVGGLFGRDDIEVFKTPNGLNCECIASNSSTHAECEHIKAVLAYDISDPNQFGTTTQAKADYYLSKLAELEKTNQDNGESAKSQQEQIDEWLEAETAKIDRKKGYYAYFLENWMRDNNTSTKKLVHGVLKLRQQQPLIEVIDEEVILMDHRFVRVIPESKSIDKSALRKHVVNTGEEVAGINVQLRDSKFSYSLRNISKGD